MKNKMWIIIIVITAVLIGGLGYFTMVHWLPSKRLAKTGQEKNEIVNKMVEEESEKIYHKSFGSYLVSENWIESKKMSTKHKFFYVTKGNEQEARPNNISINMAKNKYAKEDHEEFKTAILKQISTQIAGDDTIIFTADGSQTDNGYIVYNFTIEEENRTTIQYYIVGDYQYVLVHETVFEEDLETDLVAKEMVNSFQWKE